MNIGASPSGKAAGFGPAISEVRILPPQPKFRSGGIFYFLIITDLCHSLQILFFMMFSLTKSQVNGKNNSAILLFIKQNKRIFPVG